MLCEYESSWLGLPMEGWPSAGAASGATYDDGNIKRSFLISLLLSLPRENQQQQAATMEHNDSLVVVRVVVRARTRVMAVVVHVAHTRMSLLGLQRRPGLGERNDTKRNEDTRRNQREQTWSSENNFTMLYTYTLSQKWKSVKVLNTSRLDKNNNKMNHMK